MQTLYVQFSSNQEENKFPSVSILQPMNIKIYDWIEPGDLKVSSENFQGSAEELAVKVTALVS